MVFSLPHSRRSFILNKDTEHNNLNVHFPNTWDFMGIVVGSETAQ